MLHSIKYRADIDGLRAIAVLVVIGYHAFSGVFKSGHVGVDIFFVISGYLISTIIFDELKSGHFTFSNFYARRIRRIFPALAVVLSSMFVFGYAYLMSEHLGIPFIELGKHMAGGAGFISNFLLWKEAGYFDAAASAKPLLHLWSLGIEEQFYLVWPLLSLLMWKRRWKFLWMVGALALISFGLNVWTVSSDVTAAFYSPLTRFWELMAGGILAATGTRRFEKYPEACHGASVLGLAMIIYAAFFIDQTNFPGWWALIPTTGTFLLLAAGSKAAINKFLLSHKALVWVGMISYPLYLWHWPVLYAYNNHFSSLANLPSTTFIEKCALIIMCILLSWGTYALVEKPIRLKRASKKLVPILAASMAGLCALGFGAYKSWIPDWRLTTYQRSAQLEFRKIEEFKDMKKLYGANACFIYDQKFSSRIFFDHHCFDITLPGRPVVFLFGDSYSASLSLGLKPYLQNLNVNLLQVSSGWCRPVTNIGSTLCRQVNSLALQKIGEIKPDLVIVDAYWETTSRDYFVGTEKEFLDAIMARLFEIKNLGAKKIVLVGEWPTWHPDEPTFLYDTYVKNNKPVPVRTNDGVTVSSILMDTEMRALRYPEWVTYVSMRDGLCNQDGCLTAVGPHLGEDIMAWDRGHFTVSSSKFVADKILGPVVTGALAQLASPDAKQSDPP